MNKIANTRKSSCVKTQGAYRLHHVLPVVGGGGVPCPGPDWRVRGTLSWFLLGEWGQEVPCTGPDWGRGRGTCPGLGRGRMGWGKGEGWYTVLVLGGGKGWGIGLHCLSSDQVKGAGVSYPGTNSGAPCPVPGSKGGGAGGQSENITFPRILYAGGNNITVTAVSDTTLQNVFVSNM